MNIYIKQSRLAELVWILDALMQPQSLKSELSKVWISVFSQFRRFGFRTFTVVNFFITHRHQIKFNFMLRTLICQIEISGVYLFMILFKLSSLTNECEDNFVGKETCG